MDDTVRKEQRVHYLVVGLREDLTQMQRYGDLLAAGLVEGESFDPADRAAILRLS